MSKMAEITDNIVTAIMDLSTESQINVQDLIREPVGHTRLVVNIDAVTPAPQVGWTYNPQTQLFSA